MDECMDGSIDWWWNKGVEVLMNKWIYKCFKEECEWCMNDVWME